MKNLVISCLLALLAGCAHNPTPQEVAITRTFPADAKTVIETFHATATEQGWTRLAEDRWQLVEQYQRDPLLAVVKVSNELGGGIWVRVEQDSQTAPAMLTFHPEVVARMFGELMHAPIGPGSRQHAKVTALVETTKARVEAAVSGSTGHK